MEELHNPQWELWERMRFNPRYDYDVQRRVIHSHPGGILEMNRLEAEFSYGIADPWTVDHISTRVGARVVIIDAGMGYWAYLLSQVIPTKQVTAYDLAPPKWTWLNNLPGGQGVKKGTRRRTELSAHFSDSLLFIAPVKRKFESLIIALRSYRGPRMVIYGPPPTLSHQMAEAIEHGWVLVDEFTPVTRDIHPQKVYTYDRMGTVTLAEDGKPAWDQPTRYVPLLKVRRFDDRDSGP